MTNVNRMWTALTVITALATAVPGAKAQESSTEEQESSFTVDGAFTWMGTWGNDVSVGETITIDEQFDFESDTSISDENARALVTEMQNRGVPWTQVGFVHGNWGVSAEFWTLDTKGSTGTGDEPFEAFRYHDLTATLEDVSLDIRAENALSVWAVRVMLLRALSESITVGMGLHTGRLENRRNETLALAGPAIFFFSVSGNLETKSNMIGTLVGPSVDLRASATIGGRTRVRFTAGQSVLFARFENETDWQSAVTTGGFFGPTNTIEHLSFDSSPRIAIPVTDLRAILSFDLGSHFSAGVLGLLSVWFDAPVAYQFSQATEGWNPARSNLVFASVGPTVTVRF